MSRNRTERLVNLVICLLSTRRFLTAAQIAHTVPGYEHDTEDPRDHEAFQRKFERDKAELRELGVPLETGTASVFDTEPGYRIARPEYALPDVLLEPDEAAAVGIAARLWQHAGLASAASSGLLKLRAAGIDVDPQATLGIEPVVTVEPTFGPLTAAAGDRQAVTFSYRPPEADSATVRRLQPWGVVCWRGKWYVVGHDLDREAPRCFRLSRIVGEVRRLGGARAFQLPQGIDLIDYVARWSGPREHPGRATVLLRPGRAAGVRRTAERVDGDTAVLRYSDPQSLAGYLVGYGADVVVLDPPDVRDAVVALLERTAQRYPEPVAERKPAGAAAWSREVVR
ncbi:MAG: helix-turn-helix transcriptional regulator [Micromonosporaceae bacterium]